MWHIKFILPRVLKNLGIQRKIEATEICKIADGLLRNTFSNKSIKALFFRGGTLHIQCSNSVLANEIQLRKQEIREKINQEVEKEMVEGIRIRVGSIIET